MTDPGRPPTPAGDPPPEDPSRNPAWLSYLMPGSPVLRTMAELTDPTAIAIFERIVSADAEAALHADTTRTRGFDLAHLDDVHGRLFGEVYQFAGQHRYVDIQVPGQTGEPFLHHRWITTYTDAVVHQLQTEGALTALRDPTQWADRAAYYQAALLHAHPYRDGNGRTVRVWLHDLADAAGHRLDWTRASRDRNYQVAAAAAHGDYEPMRALLTVVAGGRTGIDRPTAVLDHLDQCLHAQAWARTGLVFGADDQKQILTDRLRTLNIHIRTDMASLPASYPIYGSTDQPATQRWRGIVDSIHPKLTRDPLWPGFADELDDSAAAGINVASELPRMSRPDPTRAAPDHSNNPAPPPHANPLAAYADGYTPHPAAPPAAASGPSPSVAPPARSGPRR